MSYLDQATNMFGHLTGEVRERLVAVLANPTQETWGNAYSIILNQGTWTTLWQAVLAVDPTFPRTGPALGEPWPRVPDYDTICRALQYAVTEETEPPR